jgi:hypothetical protein
MNMENFHNQAMLDKLASLMGGGGAGEHQSVTISTGETHAKCLGIIHEWIL